MHLYAGILKASLPGWSCFFLVVLYSLPLHIFGQETNSRASGKVFSEDNESVEGATITIVHEPTQNKYTSITHSDGFFHLFNLKPGGPYTIIVSSAGYETLKRSNLFINLTSDHFLLDNIEVADFSLHKKSVTLGEVVIDATNTKSRSGVETNISGSVLKSMPTISRTFQDFVRLVPQAKVTGDGVMSLAGQNNRFNAFFIDGANNTDIRGVAVNGINGGQTGSPPVSIEAIEEINVLLAPYNVQYGNFTGGSINAITRSGSNENKSSAWYYFRNENLAGRSPQHLEKPGSPGEFYRPRLSKFNNATFGAWNSGAIVKNKVFYFILIERQSDTRPQPYDYADYVGNSSQQQLSDLINFVETNYDYDAGSFLQAKDDLDAARLNIKFDWNASTKNKFTLSYRYNNAERLLSPRPSSRNAISFYNNGIIIPVRTHTASFEWRSFLRHDINNRLLLTFTRQTEKRKWIGQPFPSITILDGNGTLSFGSETGTGINYFKAADVTLFDVMTFVRKQHVYSLGADINFSSLDQRAIPTFFGAYQYRNLNDFMSMAAASRFQRTFYLSDQASTKFNTLRTGIFVNDEIRVRQNFKVSFGIRLDINSVLSKPTTDQFFNDSASKIISSYYDLEGATSGEPMRPHWGVSPRFSVNYKLKNGINITAGAGIFIGHIINIWTYDVFNSITGNIDVTSQQFNPDPYGQPTPASLNLDPSNLKGTLCLVPRHFKYPSVFRTSYTVEKRIKTWTFSIEALLTKNIREMLFRNVNVLPPVGQSAMPGSRNIYSLSSAPSKIPLRSNGVNPYAQVMLLTNSHQRKGYSYSGSFIIQKNLNTFSFNGSYTYLRSKVLFEVTGPQTPIASQWRNMETVNGRNFTDRSISDNDLKHRITAFISKKINYAGQATSTTISLFYNGQSGNPYSYVYVNSMINDNGRRNENFDLIYIPSEKELGSMSFAAITNNAGEVLYSPQQQKDLLNAFIINDQYLKKHRGEFAKRNGAHLPFTHIVDLRLQQDFVIKVKKEKISLSVVYDVFNFTNMINRNWGRIWFLANDSYPLITFSGYSNASTLTPEYQFRPVNGKPYTLQTSTLPGSSARWISQLGMKIFF